MPAPEPMPEGAPLPTGPTGVAWRRIGRGDVDSVQEIASAIARVEEPGRPGGRVDLDQQLADVHPARTVLAERGGVPTAYGLVFVPGSGSAVRLPGGVRPDARGAGIGRRLLDWQIAAARAVRAEPTVPISARQPVAAEATARLLARAGFLAERTFLTLRRPGSPVRPSPLPAGLRAVRFGSEYDEPLRLAKNRAFHGHWGSRPEGADAWARHQLGPWLQRDLSRLALTDDGDIAGFVVGWDEGAAADELYIALVGTDPDWRGRGVARALLADVLGASTAAGRPVAVLHVDGESPTSADRLYASVGFGRVSAALVHRLAP
ncbi:GNAT family N-acetyltransferase [Amnibacterium sp.]|uniref:GNAT family N-acetyltransferase n=1 Tax=Amnibacterium sp. TaxID=1872496 RepID=UPI0026178A80|nr:GNAT family N-acetyltransferase [Amnibacterium sp.]